MMRGVRRILLLHGKRGRLRDQMDAVEGVEAASGGIQRHFPAANG
jgi:hypothetical protein